MKNNIPIMPGTRRDIHMFITGDNRLDARAFKILDPLFADPAVTLMVRNKQVFDITFRPKCGRYIIGGIAAVLTPFFLFLAYHSLFDGRLFLVAFFFSAAILGTIGYVVAWFFLRAFAQTRGLTCNIKTCSLVVWREFQNSRNRQVIIPFGMIDSFCVSPVLNKVALRIKSKKRAHAFTRAIRNRADAELLAGFLQSLLVLEPTGKQKFKRVSANPAKNKKQYEKKHGSAPLRFSRRAGVTKPTREKYPGQRRISPW